MKTRSIQGEPSWEFESDLVRAAVTVAGGQLGPVVFDLGRKKVQPFAVAPWAGTRAAASLPPILRALRGDFFCMPFGGNLSPYRGESHPLHGETANADWRLEELFLQHGSATFRASLRCSVRPGVVRKEIQLRRGQTAVYSRHSLEGFSGPMSFGHHAMLAFPDREGSGLVSTSRLRFARVYPGEFEKPENGGYSSLKPGAHFRRLDSVPMANGLRADLSRFPARAGFEDLVMISQAPDQSFAWSAVSFPRDGYVWISLKNPAVLPSTVLWHSNGGRHDAPWSGRHRRVLGVEEVLSYFHEGLAQSVAPNPVQKAKIPTFVRLNPKRPLMVSSIMALAAIPPDFDHVRQISPKGNGLEIKSRSGKGVLVPVDLSFIEA